MPGRLQSIDRLPVFQTLRRGWSRFAARVLAASNVRIGAELDRI
jgi:hypothetical protein